MIISVFINRILNIYKLCKNSKIMAKKRKAQIGRSTRSTKRQKIVRSQQFVDEAIDENIVNDNDINNEKIRENNINDNDDINNEDNNDINNNNIVYLALELFTSYNL